MPIDREQREVLLSAIDDAQAALVPLGDAAAGLAVTFREVNVEEGDSGLAACSQNLVSLLVLTDTVLSALAMAGGDRTTWEAHRRQLAVCAGCLDLLVSARQAGDWIHLSDILEFDVTDMLDAVTTLLHALRSEAAALQATSTTDLVSHATAL